MSDDLKIGLSSLYLLLSDTFSIRISLGLLQTSIIKAGRLYECDTWELDLNSGIRANDNDGDDLITCHRCGKPEFIMFRGDGKDYIQCKECHAVYQEIYD